MKLLPDGIARKLPALGATEGDLDPKCWVKLFTPWTNWTWWLIEYDPVAREAFGYVNGQDAELGYISLDEIEAVRGPGGLRVERDRYFKPCPLSAVKEIC